MGRRIMIVGAGVLQVPAILKAKELGYEVVAVDMDPQAPGMAWADWTVSVSTNDIPGVLEAARKLEPDGVMTLATDLPVRTCAAVGEERGLVTIDSKTALRATDKGEMRLALAEHGIPIPRFAICRSSAEFSKACRRFQQDFMVKPADSSGSRGVTLVRDRSRAEEAYRYSLEYANSGRVVVEEYMTGPEVSVETFALDGKVHVLAITDKITTHAPYFVELGHTIPSALDHASQNLIHDLAVGAVQALGIRRGPSHVEIMVTPQGPKIVEIGARLGGDHIATDLVPLATGIDLVAMTIHYALAEPVVLPKAKTQAAAIRYLVPKPGILEGIHGAELAWKVPGVVEVRFEKTLGDRISEIRNSHDRSGHVITQGNDTREAVEACEEACRLINMVTREV